MAYFRLAVMTIIIGAVFLGDAYSCTLWGSLGSANKDAGETFIAKNRDWKADHRQVLKVRKPRGGQEYLGLYAEGNDDGGIKMGVSRRGLAIVSASASSIPKRERSESRYRKGLISKVLSTYASVDEVLQNQWIFSRARPIFYLIADKNKMISVEIGMDGIYSIAEKTDGVLYHTNHYLDPAMETFNKNVGRSSSRRLDRIGYLLTKFSGRLSLDEFIKISEDQSDGPRNSIFRTGRSESDEKTLARWIVAFSKNDAPLLYVALRNPGEDERTERYKLDDTFWSKGE